jgi:hypothetical protein
MTRIDLSEYRKYIQSGSETDANGHHIYKCEKGSIGRQIKEFQKEQYINENNHHRSVNLPRARTILSMEYYQQEPNPEKDQRGVWRVDCNPLDR